MVPEFAPGVAFDLQRGRLNRSSKIGGQVTRRKSRLFNYDLLGEIQFWRSFLSNSSSRITLPFGSDEQSLVISATMARGEVYWPGIPSEHDKPFRNIEFADDDESWAETDLADGDQDEESWEREETLDELFQRPARIGGGCR